MNSIKSSSWAGIAIPPLLLLMVALTERKFLTLRLSITVIKLLYAHSCADRMQAHRSR